LPGIWEFGDIYIGNGTKPTYTFTEPGEFNITLTITDDDGLISIDTAQVFILLDSDRDGWSDDLENSYGTDANNSDDQPLDTDGDGIPDNHSPDKKYVGDSDDDNDGLRDDYEKDLGSDPKDKTDVIKIQIENVYYFLVDTNADGKKDLFFNDYNQTSSKLGYGTNGTYLIDTNYDNIWDYIYDPESGDINTYKGQSTGSQDLPLLAIAVITIVAVIILLIVYLFKIGYFYIEIVPVETLTDVLENALAGEGKEQLLKKLRAMRPPKIMGKVELESEKTKPVPTPSAVGTKEKNKDRSITTPEIEKK